MKKELTPQRAKTSAWALLRVRPRSEKELRGRLAEKGYDGLIVEKVVGDLKRAGEIDDAKFARFWINSRAHLKPVGNIVLRHELQAKGISDSLIEATLTERGAAYDEYEVARQMADERIGRLRNIDRRKAMKRLYDFLARRGFAFDTISRIIDELKMKP